jgi:DNA-binding transcriptional LysR family regulator
MMELRQLRYFLGVAEEGNFSRAAERLHLSQPPLSTQIKDLENELGITLFNRTNRGVTLTAAGAVFAEEARAVLARLEDAKSKALQTDRGDIGRLAIGFVTIADYSVLPATLKSFRAHFPRVEVELHELTTDAQVRELRAGRLDVGIALGPVNEPDLAFEAVLHEELLLALPTTDPAAKGAAGIDLRTLAKHDFIVPPRELAPGLYDLIIRQCRLAGFTPRITQHARQMQTVIGLVSSGMGVALVPSSLRNLKRTGVEYRPLRGRAAVIDVGVLRLKTSASPQQQRFIETLKSTVA